MQNAHASALQRYGVLGRLQERMSQSMRGASGADEDAYRDVA